MRPSLRYVREFGVAGAVLLAGCGWQAAAPPTPAPPTPPPAVAVDPIHKRFTVPDLQTGTAVRLLVGIQNTDPANAYGGLRTALVLQAAGLPGGLGQQDAAVLAGPGCTLGSVSPVASPSDYPGGWAVEYDVDPAGGPHFSVGPGGTRGPLCVEVVLVRPGVAQGTGGSLEGALFVYWDTDPQNGRYDLGEPLRSRPLAEPVDITLTVLSRRL
ncbi:MAG: hypothetical protein QN144_14205 [Armatimonadota bacterium]|nr:hypothetical protein [Armatimonadota bacterium]MDR7417244.1 hypothetical protein [Armatimonadota bacterium]